MGGGGEPTCFMFKRQDGGEGWGDRGGGGGERNMHMRLSIHYFLFDGLLWQL